MKGLIVYDTAFGNTKKVAETIAETLRESGKDIDVFDVQGLKKFSGKDYGFLAVGSPTKFGTMSFTIRRFLGKVKSEEWVNKPFIAFDTENPENVENSKKENKSWSAAEKIAEKLKEKNLSQISPVLKALVIGEKGPLVEGEIERVRNYTRELISKLN